MMTDGVRALDLEGHLAFVDEVSRAESFEKLSDWVQEIVLEGERRLADEDRKRRDRAAD